MPIEFDPILWNPESLGLTRDADQLPSSAEGCAGEKQIADSWCSSAPQAAPRLDIRRHEGFGKRTDEKHRRNSETTDVLDALAKVVRFYHTLAPCNCSLPRSATTLRLETNPFHGCSRVRAAHQSPFSILDRVSQDLPNAAAGGPLARNIADSWRSFKCDPSSPAS